MVFVSARSSNGPDDPSSVVSTKDWPDEAWVNRWTICAGPFNCHRRSERKNGCERGGSGYVGPVGNFHRGTERRKVAGVPSIGGGNGNAACLDGISETTNLFWYKNLRTS
jgi:hypothetical protein